MVTKLLKHLHLVGVTYRFWLIRVTQYRNEVILWTVNSVLWSLLGLWSIDLIFGQVSAIAGWTKGEVLILMATQALFNGFLWLFLYPSLYYLSESIRDGKFDFLLTKPVSSRFLASFSRFEFGNYGRIIVMSILISIFIKSYAFNVSPGSVLGFVCMFFLGIFIHYCFIFMIVTLTFWFTKIEGLDDLFDSFITMGRFPTFAFKSGLRILFFYIIPVAFVATFPVSVLLQKGGWELIALGVGLAFIFYLVSNSFWHFALRHYSSASS